MIRSDVCRKKIDEIQVLIKTLGNTPAQVQYKEVLQRQLEGWRKEYIRALQRNEPQIGEGGYSHSDPRWGRSRKGAY